MSPDDFEDKLKHQPMRPLPAEWRADIGRRMLGAYSESRLPVLNAPNYSSCGDNGCGAGRPLDSLAECIFMSSAMASDHETVSGTPIKIERMKRAQAKLVYRLMHEVISHLSYYNLRARREELAKYTTKELLLMRGEDENSIIVARCGGLLVGFCISRYDAGIIWLSWFGVCKKWRGKGVGSALIAGLEATVMQRKCHKIWCDTRTSNKASVSALKNSGFERICKLEQHWYEQDFYLWQKYIR